MLLYESLTHAFLLVLLGISFLGLILHSTFSFLLHFRVMSSIQIAAFSAEYSAQVCDATRDNIII
jgi:hypothetical protein